VAENPKTSNTRYLRVLLDDISIFGDFEALDTCICRNTSKINEEKFGPNHSSTADVLYALGSVASTECNYDKAEELFNATMAIKRNAFGEEHPDTTRVVNRIATVYVEQK